MPQPQKVPDFSGQNKIMFVTESNPTAMLLTNRGGASQDGCQNHERRGRVRLVPEKWRDAGLSANKSGTELTKMKPKFPRLKQPTPKELTDSCLNLLRTKFYAGDDKAFWADRKRLLAWVVLWPASWLNGKGVTLHGDQYREIFVKVFLQAASHIQSKVNYRPAYLRQVIQSHFKIHGEDYYDDAKAVRNQVEQALMLAGQPRVAAPDPVRDLAAARQILVVPTRRKTALKQPVKAEVNLEFKL